VYIDPDDPYIIMVCVTGQDVLTAHQLSTKSERPIRVMIAVNMLRCMSAYISILNRRTFLRFDYWVKLSHCTRWCCDCDE
jgi:hypothetical protein